jgi:hypothetical protein
MTQIVPYRRRSGTMGLDNKENMPLEPKIMPPKPKETPIQKATRVSWSHECCMKPTSLGYFLYWGFLKFKGHDGQVKFWKKPWKQLNKVLIFLPGANRRFHIPLSSLSNHLNGHAQSRKMGPPRARL